MKRVLTMALIACVLAGCTKAGTIPGTLRIAIPLEPATLNPIMASNTTDAMVHAFIFDLLVTADEHGKLLPDLAQTVPTLRNGGISRDGLTITYHLRRNVRWHDGAPFTSKDVKFSWQAIMNPANDTPSRNGYDQVRSVDTPDDFTVVFHLKHRFAPAVTALFGESDSPTRILPEHLLGRYHDLNRVAFNNMPIGTGPFKVAEWVRGDHISLIPNDAYFMGAPKLKHIIIRVVPNENTAINELTTHEIDWMFQASPNTCRQLPHVPGSHVVYVEQNAYESIRFNLRRAPLDDVRVRRAITDAIDQKELVDTLTCGMQEIATEDHPAWMWAHDPSVKRHAFDLHEARRLLAQAGFTPGRDGILQKNGIRLSLAAVTNNGNLTRRQSAILVQAMLRKVGIDLQLRSYPGAQLFGAAGDGGILQLGKFDVMFGGWYAGLDPDDSAQYACTSIPPGGYDYTRYCNNDVGAAQEAALTHYDVPTRAQAYHRIERDLARDVPEDFLWWVKQAQPISNDLKGFAPNPVTPSWNSYQWSI